MEYFPFYIEIGKMKGIVIGGGKIALQKIKVLSQFDFPLTILSKEIIDEIYMIQDRCNLDMNRRYQINILQKKFTIEDINPYDFVVAATNDSILNDQIFFYSINQKKLINTVDNREHCNFIFPSIMKEHQLIIGISTGGAAPYLSRKLKEQLESTLPKYYGELIEFLGAHREEIKEMLPDMKRRTDLYEMIVQFSENLNRSISEDEWEVFRRGIYENNTDWNKK